MRSGGPPSKVQVMRRSVASINRKQKAPLTPLTTLTLSPEDTRSSQGPRSNVSALSQHDKPNCCRKGAVYRGRPDYSSHLILPYLRVMAITRNLVIWLGCTFSRLSWGMNSQLSYRFWRWCWLSRCPHLRRASAQNFWLCAQTPCLSPSPAVP